MADIEPSPRVFPDIAIESLQPPPSTEEQAEKDRTERILALARKRMRTGESALSFFREWAKRDTQFAIGTWGTLSYQWPDTIQRDRLSDQRPCLTINRMRGFIRQAANRARQANLRIKVSPVDDTGDPRVAEVLQGIIRNIERTSFADRAYATAADKQAETGLSFFRLTTEWADDTSFRQRIKIKRVKNPLRVIFDPAGTEEADFSACEYVFYVTDVDAEVYEAITGKPAPQVSGMAWAADTAVAADWFPSGKNIRIAKYYSVEREEYTLLELASGEAVKEEHFTQMVRDEFARAKSIDPLVDDSDTTVKAFAADWRKNKDVVRRERKVRKRFWVDRVITPDEILEENIWPASSHPLIPVVGEELENPETGELDWRGVVRDAADAAKAYNVEVTGLVEDIGLGHKSPVVGYKGQFGKEGSAQRKAWEFANKKPVAFLEVDPLPQDDGKFAPLPVRNSYSPDIGATVMGIRQSDEDLKSTAGYHDASLGERGPQESRVAIEARQRQDEHQNSHYLDNLRFAIAVAGKQLIELIRVVYDEPTVVRITGDGDRTRKVLVFAGKDKDPRREEFLEKDPRTGQVIPFKPPKGVAEDEIYDLSVGEFDVEVSAGQDPGSRRRDATNQLVDVMKVVPPAMAAVTAPMLVKTMDFPGSQETAERMEQALPPELQKHDDENGPKIPPQVQAQMADMQRKGQELVERVRELEETVRTKKLELMARHMSDRLKAWLELTKLAVTEENADRRLMLNKQLEVAGRFLDMDMKQLSMAAQQPAEAPTPPDGPMPPVVAGAPPTPGAMP